MIEEKRTIRNEDEKRGELRDLYARAFAAFGTRALWNMRQLDDPTRDDILAMARQLRIEGNLAARRLAEQLERMSLADF
jgi:hypothetical protein